MTEAQFRAWLKLKVSNLAFACEYDSAKPEKLLSRLSDIASEAEERVRTVRRKQKAEQH